MAHAEVGEEYVEVIPISQHDRTNDIFAEIGHTVTGRIATDQKVAFPLVSSQVICYVFIIYKYNSNAILVDHRKSRNCGEILRAYRKLFLHLQKRGIRTKVQLLDNECSQMIKYEMDKIQVDW